jgi:bromodomain-containing protein 7/9
MSIGNNNKQTSSQISAESLYNPSREQLYHQAFKPKGHEGTHFFPQRNGLPFQTFVHQPVHGMMMNGGSQPFQNNRPPNVFPQMAAPTSDYTRFHAQSPWQGGATPYVQLNQRRENLNFPPDLNIGVHSPDSPARHSSSVRVDSQQPDLALQL